MRRKTILIGLISVFVIISLRCKNSNLDKKNAVCIWDRGTVREQPKQNAEIFSTMSLGEKVTYLGITKIDSANNKKKYYKIELSDNKEGWSSGSVIVIDAEPGVIKKETNIYKRPNFLTETSHKLDKMDIVAVKRQKNGWKQIIGGKKKKKGWIKADLISMDQKDIAVGLLAGKAYKIRNKSRRMEKLKNIVDNSAFSKSVFIEEIYKKVYGEVTGDKAEKGVNSKKPDISVHPVKENNKTKARNTEKTDTTREVHQMDTIQKSSSQDSIGNSVASVENTVNQQDSDTFSHSTEEND